MCENCLDNFHLLNTMNMRTGSEEQIKNEVHYGWN